MEVGKFVDPSAKIAGTELLLWSNEIYQKDNFRGLVLEFLGEVCDRGSELPFTSYKVELLSALATFYPILMNPATSNFMLKVELGNFLLQVRALKEDAKCY